MDAPLFVCGLDLGKLRDRSALVVDEVESIWPPGKIPDPLLTKKISQHNVRLLHKFPTGTNYNRVVEEVGEMLERPPLRGTNPVLLVDGTGVGVAVLDIFRKAKLPCRLVPITIHGGAYASRAAGGGFSVAKRALASSLQVVLGQRRLAVAESKLKKALANELRSFVEKMNPDTGHSSYEALQESIPDDLALALMYCTWYSSRNENRPLPLRRLSLRRGSPREANHRPRVVVVVGDELEALAYDQPSTVVSITAPEPVGSMEPPDCRNLANLIDAPLVLPFLDADANDYKDTWVEPVEPFGKPIAQLLMQGDDAKKLWRYLLTKRPVKASTMGDPLILVHAEEDRTARSIAMGIADGMGLPRSFILTASNPDRLMLKDDLAPSMELYRKVKAGRCSVVA